MLSFGGGNVRIGAKFGIGMRERGLMAAVFVGVRALRVGVEKLVV